MGFRSSLRLSFRGGLILGFRSRLSFRSSLRLGFRSNLGLSFRSDLRLGFWSCRLNRWGERLFRRDTGLLNRLDCRAFFRSRNRDGERSA